MVLISCSHFCNLVLSAAFSTAQMALTNDTDIIVGLVFFPDFAGVHARVAMSLVWAQTTWNSQDNERQPGWISWLERVDYSYAVLQHTSSSFSPVRSHLHSAEHLFFPPFRSPISWGLFQSQVKGRDNLLVGFFYHQKWRLYPGKGFLTWCLHFTEEVTYLKHIEESWDSSTICNSFLQP